MRSSRQKIYCCKILQLLISRINVFQIHGADAEGTPERNANLSNRRAKSVLDYLTAAGIEGARLTALGYGETRPIAANDTKENRAKNRRIEFEVKID